MDCRLRGFPRSGPVNHRSRSRNSSIFERFDQCPSGIRSYKICICVAWAENGRPLQLVARPQVSAYDSRKHVARTKRI